MKIFRPADDNAGTDSIVGLEVVEIFAFAVEAAGDRVSLLGVTLCMLAEELKIRVALLLTSQNPDPRDSSVPFCCASVCCGGGGIHSGPR